MRGVPVELRQRLMLAAAAAAAFTAALSGAWIVWADATRPPSPSGDWTQLGLMIGAVVTVGVIAAAGAFAGSAWRGPGWPVFGAFAGAILALIAGVYGLADTSYLVFFLASAAGAAVGLWYARRLGPDPLFSS